MSKWGRRLRTVYGYEVRYPRASSPIRVGYVGKTSSALHYRAGQHKSKRWYRFVVVSSGRTVRGGRGPYIIWQGECGRVSLWFREVYWIHRLKPLFNIEHNKRNPDRVLPWAY